MNKPLITWGFLLLIIQSLVAQQITEPIRIHENQRCFIDAEGQPFFWMADTAWELFHRLDLEESETYLNKRKALKYAWYTFTNVENVAMRLTRNRPETRQPPMVGWDEGEQHRTRILNYLWGNKVDAVKDSRPLPE